MNVYEENFITISLHKSEAEDLMNFLDDMISDTEDESQFPDTLFNLLESLRNLI